MSEVMSMRSALQGRVREEARRQARLHGLLREGLRAGPEGYPCRQRRDRRRRPRLSRTTIISASPSAPTRASSCRWCATPISFRSRESRRRSPTSAKRARDGQLKIEEMQGGTFTITNGGIYGSLMSTPILNAPQSGILGMHKIQDRPIAVNGKVEIRPMMYLALSYDHRVVDGKEAVTFPRARQGGARGSGAARAGSLKRPALFARFGAIILPRLTRGHEDERRTSNNPTSTKGQIVCPRRSRRENWNAGRSWSLNRLSTALCCALRNLPRRRASKTSSDRSRGTQNR